VDFLSPEFLRGGEALMFCPALHCFTGSEEIRFRLLGGFFLYLFLSWFAWGRRARFDYGRTKGSAPPQVMGRTADGEPTCPF